MYRAPEDSLETPECVSMQQAWFWQVLQSTLALHRIRIVKLKSFVNIPDLLFLASIWQHISHQMRENAMRMRRTQLGLLRRRRQNLCLDI
jgi:hypothetical protein